MRFSTAFLIVIIAGVGVASSVQGCPTVPSSARTRDDYISWCRSVGTVVYGSNGSLGCNCSSSSGSTSSAGGTNDFGFLGWLLGLDPASRMAAQEKAARKEAMIAELERQRQEAIERQDAERAQRLEDISRRLRSGDLALKGTSNKDLQLKLSPTGPIRFGEYMSTPATQTTSAQLTLKTGDEATKSLQTPTTNASSAGVINPNQPPAFNADRPTTEIRELVDMLSKLRPEQQQKLIAAMKATATPDATTPTRQDPPAEAAPTGGSPDLTKKSETLTLKLSTSQKTADDLKAAAENGASPEQLKQQSAEDFKNLQQTTLTATQTQQSSQPSPSNGGIKPDTSVIDLRGKSQVVNVPSAVNPKSQPAKGTPATSPTKTLEQPDPELLTQFMDNFSKAELLTQFMNGPSVDKQKQEDLELLFNLPADPRADRWLPDDRDLEEFEAAVDEWLDGAQRTLARIMLQSVSIHRKAWPGPTDPKAPLSNPITEAKRFAEEPAFRRERTAQIFTEWMGRRPTLHERELIVYGLGGETAAARYASDRKFKDDADSAINSNLGGVRKYFLQQNGKAFSAALADVEKLTQKYSQGQRPDTTSLLANAAFRRERDAILSRLATEEYLAYTLDAPLRLQVLLGVWMESHAGVK